MKKNISDIKEKIFFCTPTLPECKDLSPAAVQNSTGPNPIIAQMINAGDLIHFSSKHIVETRMVPFQMCLAIAGAPTTFIGHSVSCSGNCLVINDGLDLEDLKELARSINTENKLVDSPFRTAVYGTCRNQAQNITDILSLISLLKPVLIVLDCDMINHYADFRDWKIYPVLQRLLTINHSQNTALACITLGPFHYDKVEAFRMGGSRVSREASPFTRTFCLESASENRKDYLLRSPAYPLPFETFEETKLQLDSESMCFKHLPNT